MLKVSTSTANSFSSKASRKNDQQSAGELQQLRNGLAAPGAVCRRVDGQHGCHLPVHRVRHPASAHQHIGPKPESVVGQPPVRYGNGLRGKVIFLGNIPLNEHISLAGAFGRLFEMGHPDIRAIRPLN